MLTAATITDEMIEAHRDALRAEWQRIGDWTWELRLELALCDSALNDALDHGGRYARGRVAKILNEHAAKSHICPRSTIGGHACTNYKPENRCDDCPTRAARSEGR